MGRIRLLPVAVAVAAVAVVLVLPFSSVAGGATVGGRDPPRLHDYADALAKSILFFEGQRSGKLPPDQRMTWRKDSALQDGAQIGVDLTGGYYDAGDNVKFGFPMAFTATVLAWGVLEFGRYMGPELPHARQAVRWATDYLLKATDEPGRVHVQVGDPYADHGCWERPEDMDTPRMVFTVDAQKPGSEVAAETAAALAAASIVFRSSDPVYADKLIRRSMTVFDFADKYRGSYSYSLGKWVCPFYCDFSGYEDELVWAAAWIYKSTSKAYYWNYVARNIHLLEDDSGNVGEFGWDDKHAGVYVFLAKYFGVVDGGSHGEAFQKKADEFVCTVLPESPTRGVNYSPGGLLFKSGGSNMQHATALSFLLVSYARHLTRTGRIVRCGGVSAPPSRLVQVAKSQADYILGDNPLNMSYMVGYGSSGGGRFPRRIHHRGSSLPSVESHPGLIGCNDGTPYYESSDPNPNFLTGAIVGGPNISDAYADSRSMFVESEPTTYINAPMVGLLGYLLVGRP